MICANCGQAAAASDHFCARCGAPLPPALAPYLTVPVPTPTLPSFAAHPQESRLWAVAAHLSALVGVFGVFAGVIVGPLAIWLIRRHADPFASANAREALNFNLSVLLYGVALAMVTAVTFGLGVVLTVPALILLGVAWLALSLAGAIRAWNDGIFHYPFTIQFVK